MGTTLNEAVGFVLLIIAFYFVINLSIINGGDLKLNTLKFFQVLFIASSLLLLSNYRRKNNSKFCSIHRFVFVFSIVNIIFGSIANEFFHVYELGLFRFSGVVFDANYFGVFSICILFASYRVALCNYQYISCVRFTLVTLVFLSGSVTVIMILFFFYLTRLFFPKLLMNPFSFVVLIWCGTYIYIEAVGFISELDLSSNGNVFLQYKINSMQLRLDPQIKAIELLSDKNAWFSGFGSGRNIQLTGKAVHNGFLQLLFSHGVFYYILFTAFLGYILSVMVRVHKNEKTLIYSSFYSLVIISFFLDPLFILAFNFLIIIFKVVYSEPIPTCNADVRAARCRL